jgi:alginate O-acetyltransferase complex protein AlgI
MLFNSIAFVFGYLPVTLIVLLALVRVRPRLSELWLVGASLFFYG